MDNMTALAMGEANRDKELMIFDWDKAKELMKGADYAEAGLRDDWEYTGGYILKNGQPVPREDTYVYLASTWAVPEISVDGGPKIPCWKYKKDTPGWDINTYWPE